MGLQLEPNDKGLGVLGVVEADFLTPTHNKQDFDDTPAYRLPPLLLLFCCPRCTRVCVSVHVNVDGSARNCTPFASLPLSCPLVTRWCDIMRPTPAS